MPLLQRVTTLIRANLNDLLDRAEDPEKLLKQMLLDLQNQMMQVKTQAAIALADQHLLEKKRQESLDAQAETLRRAELAVSKQEDELARAALERSLIHGNAARNLSQQLEDQTEEVQLLRDALRQLENKLAEARSRADVVVWQQRRARNATASLPARLPAAGVEERLEALDRGDQVEHLLEGIKRLRNGH